MPVVSFDSGSDPCVTYTYNDNASMTQMAITGGSTYDYAYNLLGRLNSVTVGGTTVNYKYNPDGIRIQQAIQGGTTTDYIIGHDVLTQAGSSLRYFVYDGHGSVRQLSDNTGALISGHTFKYDAYDNLVNSVTPGTNLLYAGEMWDSQPQQYYLRAGFLGISF